MCIAMPSLIQSFFINQLSDVSRNVQKSLINYMQLYLTPSILSASVDLGNRLFEEMSVDGAKITANANNVFFLSKSMIV